MANEQPPDFHQIQNIDSSAYHLPGMEGDRWDMEEREFFGCRPSSEKMFYAKQKRCNVGKKLLITGLAISSAPVVLPPLVIMSAFGLAASIPYGVFLASYTCTETFLSFWLPIPPPSELDWADDEMVNENGDWEDIDEGEEEEEHVLNMTKRGEILDDLDIDVVVVEGDEEGETDIGSGDQEAAIEVTNVEFDENGDIGDDEEEQLKETRGLLERIRDEGRREDDFAEANGLVDYVRELEISAETDEPRDSVDESVVALGLLDGAASAAVHPHTEYGTSEVSSKVAKSGEAELGSVTIIDVIESAENLSVTAVTIEPKVEANAAQKDLRVPFNQELSTEVKIKEKIDSMKKIVGYEATPLGTYIDEVNALYAFVGVEPPSPLKGSSADDLNLLNQKLQFLMSIVGVK